MMAMLFSYKRTTCFSIWPKFYCNTENYKELDAKGWMYVQSPTDDIHDWVGPGYKNGFYDAYDDATRTVTFGERKGKFKGMLTKRRFHIVLIDKQTPKPLDLDRADSLLAPAGSGKQTGEPSQEEGKLVDYNGKPVSVKL